MGYGYSTFHFAEAFTALDWDPPRVMGTAFMFYSNSNEWAEGLEGWHGVDQLGEDGANPNYEAMIERFEARFGRAHAQRRRRAGLRHRPRRASTASPTRTIATPDEVKDGLERIKWMPAPTAGPAPTCSSVPATTAATRATSSRSASCAAASCASTATTARVAQQPRGVEAGPRLPHAPNVVSRMSCSSCIGMRSEPVVVPLTNGSIDWYAESNPLKSMASTSGSPSPELARVLTGPEQLRLEVHRLRVVLDHRLVDLGDELAQCHARRVQVEPAEVGVVAEELHLEVGQAVQQLPGCARLRRARRACRA